MSSTVWYTCTILLQSGVVSRNVPGLAFPRSPANIWCRLKERFFLLGSGSTHRVGQAVVRNIDLAGRGERHAGVIVSIVAAKAITGTHGVSIDIQQDVNVEGLL